MTLPEIEKETLIGYYLGNDRDVLIAYIHQLRSRGWTLQDIATTLGVTRSTVHYWCNKASDSTTQKPKTVSMRLVNNAGDKTVRRFTQIPEEDKSRLAYLSKRARRISNKTPLDSPLRAESMQLDHLIHHHVLRLVPMTAIAESMGVTHRAVRARYERFIGSSDHLV